MSTEYRVQIGNDYWKEEIEGFSKYKEYSTVQFSNAENRYNITEKYSNVQCIEDQCSNAQYGKWKCMAEIFNK